MTASPKLLAAVRVFTELGWADAVPDDAETLPLGTPEQRRVAREGLRSGAWGEFGRVAQNPFGWIDWTGVDTTLLALFALRVGVDARRAARVLPRSGPLDDDLVARLVGARGPAYATRFIQAACVSSRRGFEHSATRYGGVAVRLVADLDLAVPDDVEYLKDWAIHAYSAFDPSASRGTYRHVYRVDRVPSDPGLVRHRLAEHARAAVAANVPATGPLGDLVPLAVQAGWLDRAEALDLAFAGLDAAQRPGDRKEWTRILTRELVVADSELVARAPLIVPVLAHGDAPVLEALAPALIAGADDDALADVLALTTAIKTRKAKRLLLVEAARRPRPRDDVADTIAHLVAPLTHDGDRALARAATGLLDAWGVDVPGDTDAVSTPVEGWWRPTPVVWEVPPFEVGEVSARALTDAVTELTGRPDSVVDVVTERFLALANAVAATDPEAARAAMRGVRPHTWVPGLRSVPAWVAGGPGPELDRPADPEHGRPADVHDVLRAREGAVFQRLGEIPCLLSTPSWVDLRIDPADLVDRLGRYAAAGVAAGEGDVQLAMLRTDPTLVTDEVLAELRTATVPVLLQSGERMGIASGPAIARYLAAPIPEPSRRVGTGHWRRWEPEPIVPPPVLDEFPHRLRRDGYSGFPDSATIPTWGDGARAGIAHSAEDDAVGLRLRQAARRATPLTPGLAVNMIGAQRGFHHRAATDGATSVVEAWERGLLRPGVADARLLDWRVAPGELASLATACRDLALDGLLSVLWPVLDDLVGICARTPRMPAGTVDLVETIAACLPEARAAVEAGIADPDVLDLPGVRALADRPGPSRSVTTARTVVAVLPDPVAPLVPAGPPPPSGPALEDVWPDAAGTAPAVDDHATIAVTWVDPDAAGKVLAVDITLPDHEAHSFRVVKGWYYDLEREGQCAANLLDDAPAAPRKTDAWLRWDREEGSLLVGAHRNWHDGEDGPLCAKAPRGPLTTSMTVVALVGACHDHPDLFSVRKVIVDGRVGAESVRIAVRTLLTQPDVSPARIVRLVERHPETLPALWPVLTESIRYAATLPRPPRWLGRVLEAALLRAPLLREAARRGLIPADDAAWPGLADLVARGGANPTARKARELHGLLEPAP